MMYSGANTSYTLHLNALVNLVRCCACRVCSFVSSAFLEKKRGPIAGFRPRIPQRRRHTQPGASDDVGKNNQWNTAGTTIASLATTIVVTRAQALSALRKMEELQGRRAHVFELEPPLSVDDDSIFNQLSIAASGGGSVTDPTGNDKPGTASKDLATTGERDGVRGRTNFDVLFDAAVVLSSATKTSHGVGANGIAPASRSGTGVAGTAARTEQSHGGTVEKEEADIAEFLGVMEEGVSAAEGVGALEWGWLSGDEAGRRSRRLYREAAHAQVFAASGVRLRIIRFVECERNLQVRNPEWKLGGKLSLLLVKVGCTEIKNIRRARQGRAHT